MSGASQIRPISEDCLILLSLYGTGLSPKGPPVQGEVGMSRGWHMYWTAPPLAALTEFPGESGQMNSSRSRAPWLPLAAASVNVAPYLLLSVFCRLANHRVLTAPAYPGTYSPNGKDPRLLLTYMCAAIPICRRFD